MKKIINLLLILFLIGVFAHWKNLEYGNTRWNQESIHYIRGEVTKVLEEQIEEKYGNLKLGYQRVEVQLHNKDKDVVTIHNELSTTHSIFLKENSPVVVLVDHPENSSPYYTIYNHDRSFSLFVAALLFLLLLFAVGGKHGMLSALVLGISIYLIFFFMLPLIYLGHSPILLTIVTCILCCIYLCVLVYGYTPMALVNLISVTIGFSLAALLFYAVSYFTHISGYNLSEIEGLFLITNITGLKIHGLLFAGVAIASYGAAQDVSVSISSSLLEIKKIHPNINVSDLFTSGIKIGRDIIGTMVDTLIFAFLGGSIATVLVFISYGVDPNQLISSDFFAIEVITGLIGTSVVIIMVPISAYISGLVYNHFYSLKK